MAMAEEVRIPFGDITLAGTLHRPEPETAGSAPAPALVMLQGSGPDDRDSWGYFGPIRDAFLGAGLAVLSWDKPGVGQSTGAWTDQTLFDRADEAQTALRWLRAQPGIDPARTGIWGHSQGGWIGPLAASRDPDLAFLIVNSGPSVNVHAQDLFGIEHVLRADDVSEDEIAAALDFMQALHAAAVANEPYDEVNTRLLQPAAGTPAATYFGDVSADLWHFLCINSNPIFEPADALGRIRCPVLALFGERDDLVPVAISAEDFRRIFARDDAPELTIRIFPEADHRIRVGPEKEFAPGYLDTMVDWLQRQVWPGTGVRS